MRQPRLQINLPEECRQRIEKACPIGSLSANILRLVMEQITFLENRSSGNYRKPNARSGYAGDAQLDYSNSQE